MTSPPNARAAANGWQSPAARAGIHPTTPLEQYAVRLGGGRMLLGPHACFDVFLALSALVRDRIKNGTTPPAPLMQLLADLEAEFAEARAARGNGGNDRLPNEATLPASAPMTDPIAVADAAQILGLKARQVRNLAQQLEGRRVGGRWLLERGAVMHEARRRHQRDPHTNTKAS